MFHNLLGQERTVTILRNAIVTERLPGAYLFTGPPHTGKAFAALLLAESLNCLAPKTVTKPCGQCASCRAISNNVHPDIRIVAPTGPSRILRIPQFWPRDGVKEFPSDRAMLRDLHFAPVLSHKRVFIIEDADTLNEDTGNSLLKVLEEPPSYALFVLTARSSSAVLPTIASRCQVIRFNRVPAAIIESILIEKHGLETLKAAFLAGYCEGEIGEAIRLASHPSLFEARGALLDIAADITSGAPIIQAFQLAEEFRKASEKLGVKGDDGDEKSARISHSRGLDLLSLWFSDLLRARINPNISKLVNADRRTQLTTHARHYDESTISLALQLVLDTRRYIERNANAQIATESLTTQLLSLPRNGSTQT